MLSFILPEMENADDQEFLTNLYNKYYLLMFSTAKKYFQSQADREDVVQTSMESLIKHVKRLRSLSRCTLVSYIVITVRNTCYNLLKANQRRSRYVVRLEGNPEVEFLYDESAIDELVAAIHNQDVLSRIWGELCEDDRFLLSGKYVLGLSDSELAQSLGCQPDSIRMKLTRARRRAVKLAAKLEVEL